MCVNVKVCLSYLPGGNRNNFKSVKQMSIFQLARSDGQQDTWRSRHDKRKNMYILDALRVARQEDELGRLCEFRNRI